MILLPCVLPAFLFLPVGAVEDSWSICLLTRGNLSALQVRADHSIWLILGLSSKTPSKQVHEARLLSAGAVLTPLHCPIFNFADQLNSTLRVSNNLRGMSLSCAL